ncbi:hypothetical protein BDR03DRAFT_971390 [Suillus americanus]|nr:hypothetical protein BDR03DRAFT_971390 [Suillus americanus]
MSIQKALSNVKKKQRRDNDKPRLTRAHSCRWYEKGINFSHSICSRTALAMLLQAIVLVAPMQSQRGGQCIRGKNRLLR